MLWIAAITTHSCWPPTASSQTKISILDFIWMCKCTHVASLDRHSHLRHLRSRFWTECPFYYSPVRIVQTYFLLMKKTMQFQISSLDFMTTPHLSLSTCQVKSLLRLGPLQNRWHQRCVTHRNYSCTYLALKEAHHLSKAWGKHTTKH